MSIDKRRSIEGMPLTPRQQDAMRYICKGFTFRASAELMGITYRSIDAHVRGAKARLGAANLAEAVYRLGRQGFEA